MSFSIFFFCEISTILSPKLKGSCTDFCLCVMHQACMNRRFHWVWGMFPCSDAGQDDTSCFIQPGRLETSGNRRRMASCRNLSSPVCFLKCFILLICTFAGLLKFFTLRTSKPSVSVTSRTGICLQPLSVVSAQNRVVERAHRRCNCCLSTLKPTLCLWVLPTVITLP